MCIFVCLKTCFVSQRWIRWKSTCKKLLSSISVYLSIVIHLWQCFCFSCSSIISFYTLEISYKFGLLLQPVLLLCCRCCRCCGSTLAHGPGPTPLKKVFKTQNLSLLDTGYTPPKTNMAMDNHHFWWQIHLHSCLFFPVILIFPGGGSCCPPRFSHGCLIPEDFTTSWQSSAAVLHNSQPDTIWAH